MKKRGCQQPMIEVRHSPIHGYGVFALQRIRKGTHILEYRGDRVSHQEADERYLAKEPKDSHTFLFTVDASTVIDGGANGNEARYINHGCDPNCQSITLAKRIFIEALRTIEAGEELAYDYQIQRDADDAPDVDEVFACRCGAQRCRGSMLQAPKKPHKFEHLSAMPKRPLQRAAPRPGRRAVEVGGPSHCDASHAVRSLRDDLSGDGIAVRDGFLTQRQIRALIHCAHARRQRGDFVPARIGADRNPLRCEDIRGDSICWLTERLYPPEREVLGLLEQVRLRLNRQVFLGLFELEMHYAWYPPGAGYARHVDQPRGRGQRRVSLVLYLNQRWTARDGGELKIFAGTGQYREIEPVAGRLVAFLSAGREHEVIPARRSRLSLSGWFRGRD
jgi:uncharacterized protein